MPDTDFELAHAPVADPEAVRAAVQDAVRFGPYFGWHVGPVTTVLSRRELHEPTQLRSLLDAVGVSVGSDEGRVVASTLHYGFAARCWSLTLGVWQRGGVVLDLDGLGYVVNPSGSVDLTLNDFRGWDGSALSASEVADVMAATVIADQFEGSTRRCARWRGWPTDCCGATRPRRCRRVRAGSPRAAPMTGSRRWRPRCWPGTRWPAR